jgi:hypothetical protein
VDYMVGSLQGVVESTSRCVVGYDNKLQLAGESIKSPAQRFDLAFTPDAQLDVVAGLQSRQCHMSSNEACGPSDEDG